MNELKSKTQVPSNFYDDGTTSFFWRPHAITPLASILFYFLYITIFESPTSSQSSLVENTKRGLLVASLVFITISATYLRDGPFFRPHPVLWRAVLGTSILYLIGLIFLFFQNASDARFLLTFFDSTLNVPLPEKSYAENCDIFGPQSEFWDKMDGFVLSHFIGWWLKAMMIRDVWVCWIISVMFEILEYSLEFQLPNFKECWWDHWILDVLICNWGGIYFGMKTCHYLEVKPYCWRGISNIPDYKGKIIRAAAQFTPYRWTSFNWGATESLGRFLFVCSLICGFLIAELNAFYLKFVLWVPAEHKLNVYRLVFYVFSGSIALRELYEYICEPKCKRLGAQTWILICCISIEVMIVCKFGKGSFPNPIPRHVITFWIGFFTLLVLWILWNFSIKKKVTKVHKVD